MLEMIRRLSRYTQWATLRALAALENQNSATQNSLRPFAHLLIAEKVWLLRLHGQDTVGIDLSPELSLKECQALADENQSGYAAFLNALAEDKLDEEITYRNSKGIEFRTPVRDILLHVFFHGAYHRGQVARAIREDGGTPENTDYIGFVREVG
ncbi:MAG TPA: DinB family protein [Blastocatellia bacterium]|nr:DinB family protein [Blastocatellia bacterium]